MLLQLIKLMLLLIRLCLNCYCYCCCYCCVAAAATAAAAGQFIFDTSCVCCCTLLLLLLALLHNTDAKSNAACYRVMRISDGREAGQLLTASALFGLLVHAQYSNACMYTRCCEER